MIRLISKTLRNMTSANDTSQLFAESFVSSIRRASTDTEKKDAIYNFLQSHFEKANFSKVSDFPLKSEWINTTQPLSIHRDLKGKLVLLDFFTYCCINCMHILPDLKTLETKYSVEDGLVVIGVHCAKFTNEKLSNNIESAVKRYGIKHAVINDCKGIVWNSLDVHCWPTLVLIGPNSELLFSLQGEGHLEMLDSFISIALPFMKEKQLISNHSLPQMSVTDELKSFSVLSFPGKVASFYSPGNNLLAVADTGHSRVIIMTDSGFIEFIIGGCEPGFKDGDFSTARFNSPQGIVFKNECTVFVADTENHAVREINLKNKTVKTIAGTGEQGHDYTGGKRWNQQILSSPWDLCFGENTNVLFIAMAGTHQIWALYLADEENLFKKGKEGECKVIAGSGKEENRNNCYAHAAAFAQPSGLTYSSGKNSIFIADSESSAIRELNLNTGKVNAVVGGNRNPSDLFAFGDKDGISFDVKLQHPLGVAWHEEQKRLYVADSYNHKIKFIDLSDNSCSSIKVDFSINEPGGLCVLQNQLIIADTNNHCIKLFDVTNSKMSTLSITESLASNIEVTNDEANIEISKNGGKLHIIVRLNVPDNLSFTEEAPAFWNIKFTDNESNPMPVSSIRMKLNLLSDFTVDVPQYSEKSALKILLNGSAYFCQGDSCSMSDINLLIKIRYVDGSDEYVSCNFSHNL